MRRRSREEWQAIFAKRMQGAGARVHQGAQRLRNFSPRDRRDIARAAAVAAIGGGVALGSIALARKVGGPTARLAGLRTAYAGGALGLGGLGTLTERFRDAFRNKREDVKDKATTATVTGMWRVGSAARAAEQKARGAVAGAQLEAEKQRTLLRTAIRTLSFRGMAPEDLAAGGINLTAEALEDWIRRRTVAASDSIQRNSAAIVGAVQKAATDRALERGAGLRAQTAQRLGGPLLGREKAIEEEIRARVLRRIADLDKPRMLRTRQSGTLRNAASAMLSELRAQGQLFQASKGGIPEEVRQKIFARHGITNPADQELLTADVISRAAGVFR